MKAKFLPVLFATALLAGARPATAGLDFTLHHGSMSADGASVDGTYITDGDSKIYMRIPRPWKSESVAGALELIPDAPDSRIRIENVPGVKELPFDAQAGWPCASGWINRCPTGPRT